MLTTRLLRVLAVILLVCGLRPEDLVPLAPDDAALLEAGARELRLERELSHVARDRSGPRPLAKTVATATIARTGSLVAPLLELAAKKGLRLPDYVSREDRTVLRLMKVVPPRTFELEYARLVGRSAGRLADRCESRARKSDDRDVRAWAGGAVSVLREVEQLARELEALERVK